MYQHNKIKNVRHFFNLPINLFRIEMPNIPFIVFNSFTTITEKQKSQIICNKTEVPWNGHFEIYFQN